MALGKTPRSRKNAAPRRHREKVGEFFLQEKSRLKSFRNASAGDLKRIISTVARATRRKRNGHANLRPHFHDHRPPRRRSMRALPSRRAANNHYGWWRGDFVHQLRPSQPHISRSEASDCRLESRLAFSSLAALSIWRTAALFLSRTPPWRCHPH